MNLALFVDFKRAFDLINPKLLGLKLFHYGFDNVDELALAQDYFENRSQATKLDDYTSSPADIIIGAPQGSALSSTWFDVYINDLPMLIELFSVSKKNVKSHFFKALFQPHFDYYDA